MGIDAVDGILLDLGVSSPQLDDGERGFSFQQDGPLDMRMDTTRGRNGCPVAGCSRGAGDCRAVLREYGEERFARRIAAAIVSRARALSADRDNRPAGARWLARRTPEMGKSTSTRQRGRSRLSESRSIGSLRTSRRCWMAPLTCCRWRGRLVVISFHSLEDRMVKRYMRDMARGEQPCRVDCRYRT